MSKLEKFYYKWQNYFQNLPVYDQARLGFDPATGNNRDLEGVTAFLVELLLSHKKISFVRDVSGISDFMDMQGLKYDIIGPIPNQLFKFNQVTRQIQRHLNYKCDILIFNGMGLGQNSKKVENYLQEKKIHHRVLIVK